MDGYPVQISNSSNCRASGLMTTGDLLEFSEGAEAGMLLMSNWGLYFCFLSKLIKNIGF